MFDAPLTVTAASVSFVAQKDKTQPTTHAIHVLISSSSKVELYTVEIRGFARLDQTAVPTTIVSTDPN
jgi:hypothetical protein